MVFKWFLNVVFKIKTDDQELQTDIAKSEDLNVKSEDACPVEDEKDELEAKVTFLEEEQAKPIKSRESEEGRSETRSISERQTTKQELSDNRHRSFEEIGSGSSKVVYKIIREGGRVTRVLAEGGTYSHLKQRKKESQKLLVMKDVRIFLEPFGLRKNCLY